MTNRLRASSEWARGAGPAFFKHQMFPQRIDCTLGQMDEPMALGMLLFSPGSAHFGPALSYCQQGHTPWQGGSKGYFLEENEVCLPEIVPVVKFSWTEEFLQQMRAIATATEFADPGIEEMDTVDNIAILVNHPGDRHWRFYRPDPHGFGRIRSMDLQVTTQMPLSDVQRRIEEHWPDLVGGLPGWELIDASPTIGSSFQV